MKKYDDIKFDENGEVVQVDLTTATTEEIEQTDYAMVNDPETNDTYFVIKIDDGWYLAKSVDYQVINTNAEGK